MLGSSQWSLVKLSVMVVMYLPALAEGDSGQKKNQFAVVNRVCYPRRYMSSRNFQNFLWEQRGTLTDWVYCHCEGDDMTIGPVSE